MDYRNKNIELNLPFEMVIEIFKYLPKNEIIFTFPLISKKNCFSITANGNYGNKFWRKKYIKFYDRNKKFIVKKHNKKIQKIYSKALEKNDDISKIKFRKKYIEMLTMALGKIKKIEKKKISMIGFKDLFSTKYNFKIPQKELDEITKIVQKAETEKLEKNPPNSTNIKVVNMGCSLTGKTTQNQIIKNGFKDYEKLIKKLKEYNTVSYPLEDYEVFKNIKMMIMDPNYGMDNRSMEIRELCYPNTDIFLFYFDVESTVEILKNSSCSPEECYNSLETIWIPQFKEYCEKNQIDYQNVQKVLICNKIDLRKNDENYFSYNDGFLFAKFYKFNYYIETSNYEYTNIEALKCLLYSIYINKDEKKGKKEKNCKTM